MDANLHAATTDAVSEVYKMGTGTDVSVPALTETVQAVTETDAELVHTEPRPADIDHSVADITKARHHLGYEPTTDLTNVLRRMAATLST